MFFTPQALATPASSGCAPAANGVRVPARAMNSHSASVGSRYGLPSFLLSHSQNAVQHRH
jgi:hypothetical protein